MSAPGKVMRDGLLEKRSSGLLQLWKRKRCVLTEDGLRLQSWKGSGGAITHGDEGGAGALLPLGSGSRFWSKETKELRFERMATVDCVEHKRGLVYFTVVMATGKEIDFRCCAQQDGGSGGAAWNAEIALALVRHKNLQAVHAGRSRRHLAPHLGSGGEEEEEEEAREEAV